MSNATAQVEPMLLTVEQAAARLQVRRETLHRWSCTGRFPVEVLRLGRSRRIRSAELSAWVAQGCPAGRQRWKWEPGIAS